jgi:hypothetical protein
VTRQTDDVASSLAYTVLLSPAGNRPYSAGSDRTIDHFIAEVQRANNHTGHSSASAQFQMLLVRGTEDRILPFEPTAKRLPLLVEELMLVPVERGPHNIGPGALPNGRVRSSEHGLDLV